MPKGNFANRLSVGLRHVIYSEGTPPKPQKKMASSRLAFYLFIYLISILFFFSFLYISLRLLLYNIVVVFAIH